MSFANKDESQNCLSIAQDYIKQKEYEKAEKYLLKSIKLFPTPEAEELLTKTRSKSSYSRKQQGLTDKVLRETDYYNILGVTRSASADQIKSAYRKLALQLHPDKNNALNASDAFKSVNLAFSVLKDDEKRKTYDMNGIESVHSHTENVSPEDIFRAFFGNDNMNNRFYFYSNERPVHFQRPNHFQRPTHVQQPQQERSLFTWVGALPILLFVVLPLLASLLTPDPLFSLHPTTSYTVLRKAGKLELSYYVKSDFNGNIDKLENDVIRSYISHFTDMCQQERQHKRQLELMAMYGHTDARDKLSHIKLTNCKRLSELTNL